MPSPFHGALAPGFLPLPVPLAPRQLAAIAAGWAWSARAEGVDVPEPAPGQRTWCRVTAGESYDLWVIRWGPRSGTSLHDHAGSVGALHVVSGSLVERQVDRRGARRRQIRSGRSRSFPVGHIHEVHNESAAEAISVHAYSPPLTRMTYYTRPGATPLASPVRELVTARTPE